jgi:hypothetical protein
MGSRYLTDLADVVRRAGLVAHEQSGWQTRARSSGGYDSGRPTHAMVHHTASNPSSDGQSDVDYIISCADAPLANLYLSRTGEVWVIAAGATNTNGKGGPLDGVPVDSMNTHAVGIEAANNGVGEQWPIVQQDAYVVLVRALQDAYAITHCRDHTEWAPGRKCDNTGPSRFAPSGCGGGCNGADKWDMSRFRNELSSDGPLPPFPIETDEPMDYLELMGNSSQYSLFARAGVFVVNITNAEREADKRTRAIAPPTHRTSDATVLKSLILCGDAPIWYDGSQWPPVSAFGGHLA